MDRNAFRHDAEVEFGTVGQAMTGRPLTFEPHDRASDAALRMTADGVSGAPVVERGRVVGVIALSDLLTREGHLAPQTTGPFLRGERHLAAMTVSELMTSEPVTIRAGAPVVHAIELMVDLAVNRLPVVDANEHVVGIIAREDVLRAVADGCRLPTLVITHAGATHMEAG